ncbi:MAG: aminotransferase class V-fold PLP-dependent enzyme [Acidobacteriaceae bacterium]|nr:aminotransferase class V-fold PLP-dependent enzyme [Acidobacteriaceae bacterium]MBV9499214.1 aminotransferase class V-fold PLP-dependent enzyme [Acidobacteriaceae bacterium]
MNGEQRAGASPAAAMSPEEFLEAAQSHSAWIAHYFEKVRDFPVLPAIAPGELAAKLPQSAPETGESIENIFSDFRSVIFPGLTLWNHPRFFAWFSVSSTQPAILADFLAATLNVNAMLWKSSPAATELEQVTLSWLRQWLELDDSFFGIIYDTASTAVLHAIGAAREYVDPECRTKGARPGLIVYVCEHTHSSSEKAAIALGFGQENVRKIPVDAQFRMRADVLEQTIQADLGEGKRPCCIVASVGSTSTSAIDPVQAIADIAERYNIWLHVDAAYGGSAAVVPEMRQILEGAARAHSLMLNPHKWLYVSIDCSVLYTRYPEILRRAFALGTEYLRTAEDESVTNYNEYGVQLGRRFRALKLWYVMRYYGRQGIVSMLRESLRLAQTLKSLIEQDDAFEICAPVPFSLVCFRHRGDDELNRNLLAEVNASGKAFLSQTVLNGNFVLRFAIGNFQTTEQDVRETWSLIRETAARIGENEPAGATRA